ncbi:zinc finger (ccch type) motif-containing protein, partial [Cystoisospora suis]
MADNFGCEDPSCKETRNRRCVQPGELTGVSLDGDDGLSPADHRDGDAVAGTRKGVRLDGGTEREKTPQRRQGADGGSEEGGRTTTVEKESGMRQCTGDTSVASRIDGDNSAGSLPRMALAPHLEEEQQSASVGVRKSNNAGETISEDDSGNKSTSGRRRRSISSNITTPVRLARACSQYYRTKMCLYVLHGRPCSRGHKCVYAHSEEELRVPPDLSRTRLCPSLKQQGTCPKEESCPYAHSTVELRHTVTVFKTKICHMWNKGKCGAGAACRHAHGVDELKHYRQLSHRELVALSRGPSGVQRDGESGIGGGASSTSRPTSPHPTEACQRSSEGSPVSGGPRSADPEKKSRIPEETEASEEPPAKSSATVDTAKEDRLDLSADTPSRTERLQVEERADEGGSIKAHPSRRKRREPRKNFGEVKKAWKEAVQQGPTKEQTDDRAASPCQASSSGRPRPGSEGHVSEGGSRSPVTSVRSQVPAPGAPRSCPLTGRWTNEIGTPSSRVAWGIYEASEEIPDLIGNPGCRASRGSARPSAGCGVARPVEATNPFRPCGDATGVLLDNVAGRTEIFSSTGKPRSAACCAPRTSKTTLSPPPRPAGQYATDIDGLTVAGKAAYATASEVFRCLVDVGGTVSKDNQRERPDERKVRPSTLQKAHGTSSGMGSSRNQRLLQANASSFLGGRPVASRPWPPSVYPAGSSPSGAGSLSEAGDFLAVAQLLALLQNPDSNCASKESRGGFQDARVPAFHPHNAAPAAWETQSHQPSPEPDTAFPSQSTSPGCSAVAGHESGNQNVYTTHRTHRVVPASMGAARVPPSPSAAAVPGSGPDSKGDVAAAAAWELLLSQRCRTELPRDLKQGCEGAQGGRSSRGVRTDAHSFIPGVKIPPIAETRPLVSMSRGWGSMTEKRQPRKDVRPASRLDLYAPSGMGLADDFSSSALQHILSLFRSSKASGQGESVPPCSKSVGAAIGFSQGMPDSCAMPAESNDYDAPGSRTTAAWETCIPAPVAGKSEVLRSGAARAEPFIGGSCSSDLGEWQPSTQLIGVDSGL